MWRTSMSDTSRRKFLAAAGIGAAGSAGLMGGLTGEAAAAAPTEATRSNTSAREPVVAYVEHHFSDRVHLMSGEREVVVHDRDLATRILNAAGGQ
jgi:nitrous oxide reductase